MQRRCGREIGADFVAFQYPRSDRRRCNRSRSLICVAGGCLSVSSVGSEAMQPNLLFHASDPSTYFQYPRSDRRRCNKRLAVALCATTELSVSSVGSEAMQHAQRFFGENGPYRLSVSSVGSEAMQRRSSSPPVAAPPAFSILGRIGGDATIWCFSGTLCPYMGLSVSSVGSEAMQRHLWPRGWLNALFFQYPRSDRRRCNTDCLSCLSSGDISFQYPRSDRRRCNQRPRPCRRRLPRFQYPRSDRRRCNAPRP